MYVHVPFELFAFPFHYSAKLNGILCCSVSVKQTACWASPSHFPLSVTLSRLASTTTSFSDPGAPLQHAFVSLSLTGGANSLSYSNLYRSSTSLDYKSIWYRRTNRILSTQCKRRTSNIQTIFEQWKIDTIPFWNKYGQNRDTQY